MYLSISAHDLVIPSLPTEVLSPLAYRQMREYVKWYDDLIEAKKGEEQDQGYSQGRCVIYRGTSKSTTRCLCQAATWAFIGKYG